MSKRVLVAYDTSEQAEYALTHALNSFEDADIVLFHVVEPFADHTSAAGYDGPRYREQLESSERMLADVQDSYDDERIETVAEYGRPTHMILRHIEHNSIDHVVIGSHGRDGAARLLLGSVAETVARRSPIPVTVVRKPPEGFESPGHVLVPFEASTSARRALEYALDQFGQADVTALYVAYPAAEGARDRDTVFDVLEDWDARRAEHIGSILDEAKALATEHDRSIQTKNVDGQPPEAIVDFTEENDVDHVVIGSTGRDGLARLLLGSVAETVIRRSPVSVTVVK